MKKRARQTIPPDTGHPSRTRKKKAAQAAQRTGEGLLALSDEQLQALGLPASLLEAVIDARRMKSHGARRRQLQYIGSLMRELDVAELQRQLDQMGRETAAEVRRFRQIERWRDELVGGNTGRIEPLLARFPDMDRDALLKRVAASIDAQRATERRKAGRALFRYLRRFVEDADDPVR